MNMFARFDENPAMTLRVIKETKRYGRTDGRTHGRTHGQLENSIPPTNKVCGGYNKIVNDLDIDSNTPASWDCKNSNYLYPSAGHVITGNLNVIPDARVRNIISKGPKYRFPSNIDFSKCRREIAASLNDFSNRWCKRENVEPDALKEWKINIFKLLILVFYFTLVIHIFCPLNLNLLLVILNEVSRIFIWTMFWFQQIKLLTML